MRKYLNLFSSRSRLQPWEIGKKDEIRFWSSWIENKGLEWSTDFNERINPESLFQEFLIPYLNADQEEYNILDVGSGPLTSLGKKMLNKTLNIYPIDPLADDYNKLLTKHQIIPPIKSIPIFSENLTKNLPPNSFDLTYSRNALDHSLNPERSILQMLTLTKRNCYCIIEGKINEGLNQKYHGLHQWNFFERDGEFIIANSQEVINFSEKYGNLYLIKCETDFQNQWLKVIIKKS